MPKHHAVSDLNRDLSGAFNDIISLKCMLEEELATIPQDHTRKREQIERWLIKLSDILTIFNLIETSLLYSIEQAFHCQFESSDLVKLVFFRPSIKSLFLELQYHFNQTPDEVSRIDFETLSNLGEAAEGLALLGDSAIELAAAQLFWESKIPDVKNITLKRAALVSNEHLAKTCDDLNIYNSRIHNDPPDQFVKEETIQHTKGNLIEGIYGILYYEKGMAAVLTSLIAIQ